MGWFGSVSGGAADEGRGGLVGVLSADHRRTAGAGVYLAHRTLLTCAHVVNEALGHDILEPRYPGRTALQTVFPELDPGARHPARLVAWVPPRPVDGSDGPVPCGAMEWAGDLAVLELDGEPPPAARPVAWVEMAAGQEVRTWYGGGQRFSYADVRVGSCNGRVGYLDGQLSGAAIGPGYSGGPLWSPHDSAVVGLVAGHVSQPGGPFEAQHVLRRSWALPWQAVRRELERAGYPAPSGGAEVSHAAGNTADWVRELVLGPLRTLLGEPALRADQCRALASQLGLECASAGAPSIDELASLLLSVERALPTLVESLAPTLGDSIPRAEVNRLLSAGRLAEAPRLLSVAEHRSLLSRLHRVAEADSFLLPRAARAALPHTPLPEPLCTAESEQDSLDTAVRGLEMCGDGASVPEDTPGVPALMRFVEHVAAGSSTRECVALQGWNDRLARRLGIHSSALDERRSDALAWIGRRTAPETRVVVALDQHPGDPRDHYHAAVWRVRADGVASRAYTGSTRPRASGEIATLVREVVGSMEGTHGGTPLVEFVVDRSGLQLPVDAWEPTDPSEIVPAALGEDFHVVLRCPQLRRRSRTGVGDWRRRWAARDHCVPLTVDERTGGDRELIRLLRTTHRDCSRVVLHCGHDQRPRLLDICLAMGVPVLLWDRAATGGDTAHHLQKVQPTASLAELPERVRCFRVDACADPDASPARPALVWEDADLDLPPELRLADPWDGADAS